MKVITSTSRLTQFFLDALALLLARSGDRERGDVPGWVMITLMSAVLVAALLAIAGPALEGLFNQAIDQVSP
ncbi:hypothetical protein [Arthrobacter sp. TMS2-4]